MLMAALLIATSPARGGDAGQDIQVAVQVDGEVVRVHASYSVEASPRDVWSVLTDFEHLPRFIANVKSSAVVARNGDLVTVAQAGEASYGLIKFPFDSVRELRLTPFEKIQSRMISGSMTRYEGTTELIAEGAGTRVTQRSESVPGKWIPPAIGPYFIEHETREQLSEFRAEVLRRKSAPKAFDDTETRQPR
jgi:carbon monoxide dehydrogenase subunit G